MPGLLLLYSYVSYVMFDNFSIIVDSTDETKDERYRKSSQPNVNHQSRHAFFLGLRLHLSNSQGAELYFSGIV
jgi:hypothetical protein